jgi:hypothetical protein
MPDPLVTAFTEALAKPAGALPATFAEDYAVELAAIARQVLDGEHADVDRSFVVELLNLLAEHGGVLVPTEGPLRESTLDTVRRSLDNAYRRGRVDGLNARGGPDA